MTQSSGNAVRAGVVALLLAACSAAPAGTPGGSPGSTNLAETPTPSPSGSEMPSPTPVASIPAEALTAAELKYRLVDELGPLWFCDPDQYPVAKDDEAALAKEHFEEIRRDQDTYGAIVEHLGIDGTSPTDDERLAIYREWKMLNAIALEDAPSSAFAFDYLAQPAAGEDSGTRSTGTIAPNGQIEIERREAASAPACPICLARGTLISTPAGQIPVERLGIGDVVWSLDAAGQRIAVPIVRIGSMAAPRDHEVVQLHLDDGRDVWASPSHPLGDGRRLGEVRVGDRIDGARVVIAERVAYEDGRTYDLLPGGPTGIYWAGDIPLLSTLTQPAG